MMSKEERTYVVHEVDSALEGQIFEDLLQEAGIPALVAPTRDAAFDGYEAAQKGWGRVVVLAEDKEEAERIIEEFVASREPKARKKKATKKKK